jgi:pimeloyl-ACP methyl ester carboxylesterase
MASPQDGFPLDPLIQGPPSLGLFLLEGQRAVLEGMSLIAASPFLDRAPRGDGHPVLVLPGFSADDDSTGVLRRFLRRLGYDVHPWLLGRNLGFPGFLRDRLLRRVLELHARRDEKLTLIGWSLGGIYARELAKLIPRQIRRVITLGSPFADAGRATNVSRLFELLSGRTLPARQDAFFAQLRDPPPVPSTAIYSRSDGVAHWSACREPDAPNTDNIEVIGSHCGLGVNPFVLYAIADRLALAEGSSERFERSRGWRSLFYR